jgi:hypothetical protein
MRELRCPNCGGRVLTHDAQTVTSAVHDGNERVPSGFVILVDGWLVHRCILATPALRVVP